MENKKDCKIVEDLLPSYIDNLLSEESKVFVENHLKTCEICQKTYNEMTSEIQKEDIQNTENIKIIKKYKRKIKTLKVFVILAILILLAIGFSVLAFRYSVVKNALLRNINYDVCGNFRIEQYEESIERYEYHTTTYFAESKMKKVKGDEVLEYWEDNNHYYIDNENKTYFIKNEDIHENDCINIPILVLPEMENLIDEYGISPISILKFILTSNITIQKEAFRAKEYYIIKDMQKGIKVYLDQDTFFAERIVESSNKCTEYRTLTSSVGWREVTKPDLSSYTLVKNEI